MSKNKKVVAGMTKAAVAAVFASTILSTTAFAAADNIVLNNQGKSLQYNLTDLGKSYMASLGYGDGTAVLYSDYVAKITSGATPGSIHDSKGYYVDYAKLVTAFMNNPKTFSLNTATESAVDGDKVTPASLNTVSVGTDGKIVVTPAQDQTTLKVDSVTAITDTKLSVKLSKAVDDVTAANFSIAGVTVNSATLSADKTEVKLDVTGLEVAKAYTVKATGLKINAVVQADLTKDFTMPNAESLFSPDITFAGNATVLKADGAHSVLVTFTLKDANGNIMTDADKVEVAFTTTFGNFAEKKVTVQNGVATVMLTSESLDSVKSALITAQVVEAANKNLINLQKQAHITMDPAPEITDETAGASVTEAEAEQADRVILYFNKDVSVSKYAAAGKNSVDTSKATITVSKDVKNDGTGGTAVNVIGYLPVPGNTKALYAVLDAADASFPLTDNANVRVDFTDKTGTIAVPSSKTFKLTDSRRPAMLSVAREGLKTLKVTFSEPVQKATAEAAANWVIDGINLGSTAYGVTGNGATATVGTFDASTGTDTRNVVTITLGKDASANQIYFKSGKHSIQGSSIGDWANATDIGYNVMNTQTLDFDIPVDNNAPNATVEVQSPEQYVVSFDKDLVKDLTNANIKLQKYNKDTATWEDYTKQTLQVTKVADTSKYKVEVTRDWTDPAVYDTDNSNQNYYNDNYRLFIAKDTVAAAANGVKNVDIALTLGGAMTTPDFTSPIISNIDVLNNTDGTFTGSYKVTMSEPIKGYDGLATIAERQPTLPIPTAQFVKKDGSKTVNGVVAQGSDAYDKELKVTPIDANGNTVSLESGDWTVVVRSISDDIGNTAASATKDFNVPKTPDTNMAFKALWAFADTDADFNVNTHNVDNDKDYVYVKFNKALATTGDAVNALKTSNYLLDGSALPTGTQIRANIAGYDDKDAITDSITIVLPEGYLNGKNEPHVLTIASYIQDTAGEALTNGGEKKLSWNWASTVDPTSGVVSVDTEAKLKTALADDSVRAITLTQPITLTNPLTVSRAVDLIGAGITGNVTYSTNDSGTINLGTTINGNLTVNTPNADFVVKTGVTVTGTTSIKDVLAKSFINNGTLAWVDISDTTGASFINAGAGTVTGQVVINTTAQVTVGGTIGTLSVIKPADVVLNSDANIAHLGVEAKGVTLTNNGGTATLQTSNSVDFTKEITLKGQDLSNLTVPGVDTSKLAPQLTVGDYTINQTTKTIDVTNKIANGVLPVPTTAPFVGVTLDGKAVDNSTVVVKVTLADGTVVLEGSTVADIYAKVKGLDTDAKGISAASLAKFDGSKLQITANGYSTTYTVKTK